MMLPKTVACLVVLSLAARLSAETLPVEAIGEDTVAVVWLDTAKLDAKTIATSAAALLGEAAKDSAEPLAELEKMRQDFTKAGGVSLAIVFRGPGENGRMPEPFFLINLAPGTNTDAATEAMKKIAGNVPVSKLSERSLVVVPDRWKPAPATANDTHKAFEKALAAGGDSPAQVVFIPSDALRALATIEDADIEQMEKVMPAQAAIIRLGLHAATMKQITATATLGAAPRVAFAAVATDAKAAEKLARQMKATGEAFGKMVGNIGNGPGAEQSSKIFGLMDQLFSKTETKVTDATVTAEVSGKTLATAVEAMNETARLGRERAKRAMLASQMHQLAFAIIVYDSDNGKLPDKLEDVEKYIDGGKEGFAKLIQHPITGDKIGITYVKPAKRMRDVQRPSITAILFEMKDGKIVANGWTAYADGHVQFGPPAPGAVEEEKR